MLNEFKYLLVYFIDGDEHICQLYKSIQNISEELNIHRSTISRNFTNNKSTIIKEHEQYYIIKI